MACGTQADNRVETNMNTFGRTLSISAALLLLAGAAIAQDDNGEIVQGDPISGDGLALGEEVQGDGMGETYVEEVFQDWEMRCVRVEDGSDPCQLFQLLQDEEGNSVAEISKFGLPEGGEAVAGATIITPLETLLTQQIAMSVDGGAVRRYPFTWCSAIGCVARVGFTEEEVAEFRRGAEATLTIVPAAAPDQQVNLSISLMGFSAGFDAVNEANQAN